MASSKNKKPKSFVPVGRIKAVLRRVSYQTPVYGRVLSRAALEPGIKACELCSEVVYTGTSEKNLAKLKEKYGEQLTYGNLEVDHINPVVDPIQGWVNWDTFINRLFVGPEELRALCKNCHSQITENQNKSRKKKKKM